MQPPHPHNRSPCRRATITRPGRPSLAPRPVYSTDGPATRSGTCRRAGNALATRRPCRRCPRCRAPRVDRAVHPLRGLRAARRGGGGGRPSGGRPHPLRRDGQPLRPEPHPRADGVQGPGGRGRKDSHRRAPHGPPGGPPDPGLRGRGRRVDLDPPRGDGSPRPLARPHSRPRLQGGPRAEPRDPARLARLDARPAGPRARHVRQPGLRGAVVPPRLPRQAPRRARGPRPPRGGGRAADPARGGRGRQDRQYRGDRGGRRGHVRGGLGGLRIGGLPGTIAAMRSTATRSAAEAGRRTAGRQTRVEAATATATEAGGGSAAGG